MVLDSRLHGSLHSSPYQHINNLGHAFFSFIIHMTCFVECVSVPSRCRFGVVSRLFQQHEGRYFNIFHFVRPATVNHDQPPYEIHYAQPITIVWQKTEKWKCRRQFWRLFSFFFILCRLFLYIVFSQCSASSDVSKIIKKSKTKQKWDWMQFAHNDRNSVSNAAAIQNRKLRLNKQTKK